VLGKFCRRHALHQFPTGSQLFREFAAVLLMLLVTR